MIVEFDFKEPITAHLSFAVPFAPATNHESLLSLFGRHIFSACSGLLCRERESGAVNTHDVIGMGFCSVVEITVKNDIPHAQCGRFL